jgi:hypothetical protein
MPLSLLTSLNYFMFSYKNMNASYSRPRILPDFNISTYFNTYEL